MNGKQYKLMIALALLGGMAGGTLATVLLGDSIVFATKTPKPAKILAAEEFLVVDKVGNPRAVLGVSPDGVPGLVFFNNSRKTRAVFGLSPDGEPNLILFNEAGKIRAALGVLTSGELGLDLYDNSGKPRAGFGVSREGAPGMILINKEGITRAGLGILTSGEPGFVLFNQDGASRATLAVLPDEEPGLILFSKHGKPRAKLGYTRLEVKQMEDTGSTSVMISDKKITTTPLVAFDNDGKAYWHAPGSEE